MKLIIAKPDLRDFPEIFLLLRQLWPKKKFDKEKQGRIFAEGLQNPSQEFLVARSDGKIIGFASLAIKNSLWDMGNLGHINELVVDKSYRNKGIGKRLLREIIRVAKKKSCERVELDSAFRRKKAHKFYELQGFKKCNFLFSKKI